MKLSTRGRYGLRALIDLAAHQAQGAVSVQSIAFRQHISVSYLEQLIRRLKKGGLVLSVLGAGGGYTLARPAEEISVGDALRCLEGGLDVVDCSLSEGETFCTDPDACITKFVWKRVNDAITDAVDSIHLSDLIIGNDLLTKTEAQFEGESDGNAQHPMIEKKFTK